MSFPDKKVKGGLNRPSLTNLYIVIPDEA